MRTTTVPAQITTVEDKIAGELSLVQLVLLVIPLFLGAGIFAGLPPFFASAPYKIVVMTTLTVICASLAIRIKDRIVLSWTQVLVRYYTRPRYYVFNKNDLFMRELTKPVTEQEIVAEAKPEKTVRKALPHLSTADLVKVEQLIANPKANLHFKTTKKGVLRAYFTETN